MHASQPQIQVDPNLAAEQQQAQQDQVAALQTQATGDTAALMARYGTQMALSGVGLGGISSAPIARAA